MGVNWVVPRRGGGGMGTSVLDEEGCRDVIDSSFSTKASIDLGLSGKAGGPTKKWVLPQKGKAKRHQTPGEWRRRRNEKFGTHSLLDPGILLNTSERFCLLLPSASPHRP